MGVRLLVRLLGNRNTPCFVNTFKRANACYYKTDAFCPGFLVKNANILNTSRLLSITQQTTVQPDINVQKPNLQTSVVSSMQFSTSLTLNHENLDISTGRSSKVMKVFSGIQPTGDLHLGNYFGAVRQWVDYQNAEHDVMICIVDLHAITLPLEKKTLRKNTLAMAASLIALGIDPSKSILFLQNKVWQHEKLYWILGSLVTMARLGRLAQYKEKSNAMKEVPFNLFSYPVLQASDILLYKTTHVPVGDDQKQHIQVATQIADAFNKRYGEVFPLPRAIILDASTARLKSLRQPSKKMSKSEPDERSRINIMDSPDVIIEKFKKSMTDFTSEVFYDEQNRPGISNLMNIHSIITGKSIEDIRSESIGMETAKYKFVVADAVIEFLKPVRNKAMALLADEAALLAVLENGAVKARVRAQATLKEVQDKVDFC